MPAKKATTSKSTKKPAQGGNRTGGTQQKPPVKTRSLGMVIVPYVMCVLALILGVCFLLVNFGGSAGVVGEVFQAFFCALFGPAAFALPLILGYIGVRWCIFNIKWSNEYLSPAHEQYADYKKAKKRMAVQVSMTSLTFLMVSAFIGVIADQRDLGSLWGDGIDLVGGGLFGGSIACLFLLCFELVVSIIILCILIILFALLAIGITPNYILTKMRDKHEADVAQKAVFAEQEAKAAAAAPASPLRTTAPAPASAAATAATASAARSMSVDDIIAESGEVSPKPVSSKVAEEVKLSQDVPIGPSAEQARRTSAQNVQKSSTPLDFGGDSDFSGTEFDSVDNILKGLDTPIAPSRTEEPKPTPAPTPAPAPEEISMSAIKNDELLEDMAAVALDDSDEDIPEIVTPYVFPPIDFLAKNKNIDDTDHTEELQNNAKILVETLRSFRVGIKEVTYSRGPTITRYELKPEVGTRVRSIANLVDDIALNLATSGVRIEAPIPGKAAVGIEVPNQTRATVYLRDLIDHPKFTDSKSKLTAALGMDVGGNPIHFDIGKMPHLLIAGTTGSGKSICINCIIISILYKAKPEELKLILIDPKKVEFNMYKNIPHLYCPIVSEPKKAAGALASAVAEMERRFELIEQAGVRDIASYNAAAETDPELEFMPHMVIIIDELADLMMTARDEVETSICRIAQKARAAGIHMILGTQRPSVDVITGLIKANVPSRIACTVMSQVDSRTIIDVAGAENLIGRGDMLFAPVGASKPVRVQGAFVSENEIEKIVSFVKDNNGEARYNTDFINKIEEEAAKCGMGKKGAGSGSDEDIPVPVGGDSKFSAAVKIAIESGKISTSLMQRRLGVGFGRASKMIDTMQDLGYVSPPDGNKPRQVYITMDEYMRRVEDGTLGGEE